MANPVEVPVKCGGDIRPCRFVTQDTTENNTVVESNLGDLKVVGVSQESTKNAPQEGGSTLAGADGDEMRMFPRGSDPIIELGSGGCAAGDWLKPDNDGKAIVAASADVAHAHAWEAGSEGEKVKISVLGAPYLVP